LAMEPVAAVGDRHLTDRRAHLRLGRGHKHGVTATGAAAAEDRAAPRIDIVAAAHVRDGVAPVRELPGGQERAALTVARAEAAVVEDQEREASVGESAVVRLVELRVGQPHPPGPLDDEWRAAAGFVGAMEEAVQPDAVAIEGDLIRPHAFDLYR